MSERRINLQTRNADGTPGEWKLATWEEVLAAERAEMDLRDARMRDAKPFKEETT